MGIMNDKGFTIAELIFALVWVASLCAGAYVTYLVILALKKYVGV
jgi:Tfp pilus assembly protein PilE